MSEPVVRFDSVSKKFTLSPGRPRTLQEGFVGLFGVRDRASGESFWALRDINLTIPRGQMTGLIGTNGSGKSTLLSLISRIIFPSSGTITIDGRVGALLELGAGFHPDLTGRENIFLSGSLLGLSHQEVAKRFDAIVDFSGLEDFIYVPVKHYSSGMFMRLGFSTVIHLDPDILLVDEILAVGDQAFQQKCLARIAELRRQQKTIILVSHDLSAVRDLCDWVVWLDDGRIRAEGLPREIASRYLLELWQREGEEAVLLEEQPADDPRARSRWGSREVEIAGVHLQQADGSPLVYLRTGDPLRIVLDYQVNRPTDDLVFGVGIFRADGTCCYGSNTMIDAVPLPALAEHGQMVVHFPRFSLLSGDYTVDVAAHARDERPYDYQRGALRFAVRAFRQEAGVFRPEHHWLLDGQELAPELAAQFYDQEPGRNS